jgi:lysozyme
MSRFYVTISLITLGFLASVYPSRTFSAETVAEGQWKDVQNDTSRATLFADEVVPSRLSDDEKDPNAPIGLNIPKEFNFPDDARFDKVLNKPRVATIFGIDISHYTGSIKFNNLALQRVNFVYAKATQGIGYKDSRFAQYWDSLASLQGQAKVYRGAYHFLTAGDDPEAQAKSFIKYINLHGGLKAGDMPPCLDLEWDRTSTNPDRWKGQDVDKILAKAKKWLEIVEKETGRTPILYTARSWWKERGISEGKLAVFDKYKIWVADYSTSHKAAEKPAIINGKQQTLWQFADDSSLATGYAGGLDANIYYGTSEDFKKDFGLATE